MQSSVSLAAKGSTSANIAFEEPNRLLVSDVRNDPRACATSSGIVIICTTHQLSAGSLGLAGCQKSSRSNRDLPRFMCKTDTCFFWAAAETESTVQNPAATNSTVRC